MLKAIFLELRGVLINDRLSQETLLDDLLLTQNLRLHRGEYAALGLEGDDLTHLTTVLDQRGHHLDPIHVQALIESKAQRYAKAILQPEDSTLPRPSLYGDVKDFLFQAKAQGLKVAVVTAMIEPEVTAILGHYQLDRYLDGVIKADRHLWGVSFREAKAWAYHQALTQINHQTPGLHLTPQNCLVVEPSYEGLAIAKRLGFLCLGIARRRPFHMMHRRADWVVDHLRDLEWSDLLTA